MPYMGKVECRRVACSRRGARGPARRARRLHPAEQELPASGALGRARAEAGRSHRATPRGPSHLAVLYSERTVRSGKEKGSSVNLVEGLSRIRDSLVKNRAQPATLAVVDTVIANADAMQGGGDARVQSLLQVTRMLQRTPAASANVAIYNDLTLIEQQLTVQAQVTAREREAEAAKPLPKSKKFYKEQKERQQKSGKK